MAVTQINGGTQIQDTTITPAKVTSGIIVAAGTNAFSGDQSHGGFKITNLGTPSTGTDAATKAYVDTAVTGLLDYKGATDCSANPNYPAALKGDAYYVSVAGRIGGASGKIVSVGDVYVANADNAGGDEAAVGTSWFVLEGNISGLSANGLSLITAADYAAMRTLLGLVIGTNIQAYDATLAALAGLTIAANSLSIGTGADAFSQVSFAANTFPARASTGDLVAKTITDFGLSLVDDTDAAAARATLGGTTVGQAIFTATNPSAIRFLRVNADNSIDLLSASDFRTAISAIGGTVVTRETPSGTINGSNPTFTLANTPTAGTEHLYLNGILQDSGSGNDYTISGGTITMLNVPISGDKLRVSYSY